MSTTTEKEITVADGFGNADPSQVLAGATFSSEDGFNQEGTFIPSAENTTYDNSTSGRTEDNIQDVIDGINSDLSNKSDTSHTHDDRYYTETEIDTKLSGKSDTSHNHNSSYYTKSEVDSKIGGLITSGTTDLTAGTSELASGVIYAMYE